MIAVFHRAHHFTKKRKARLEARPAGMHMLDDIFSTFVSVQTMRKERNEGVHTAAIMPDGVSCKHSRLLKVRTSQRGCTNNFDGTLFLASPLQRSITAEYRSQPQFFQL